MEKALLKYKIGLLVVFGLALVITGLVLAQARTTKQDTKTNTTASDIANQLNDYVDTNAVVPGSLGQAGIKHVPNTISYHKLSDDSYKFCATYKGNSSNFDASGAVTDLMTGSSSLDSGSTTDTSVLTIDSSYHKGSNCQTIQPTIVSPTSQPTVTNSSSSSILCSYGPVQKSSCKMRCGTPVQNAGTTIDGTINDITDGSGNTFKITDTKNLTHTVNIGANATIYDSECDPVDPNSMVTSDQVRIFTSASSASLSVNNSQISPTEVDDLSY